MGQRRSNPLCCHEIRRRKRPRISSRPEVVAMTVTPEDLATAAIDDMLRLVERVRAEKPRDPMRRLEDVLLDMRCETVGHG